jgi:hypothetical protein
VYYWCLPGMNLCITDGMNLCITDGMNLCITDVYLVIMQIIHWFTNNKKAESEETMTLLDAIYVSCTKKYINHNCCHLLWL